MFVLVFICAGCRNLYAIHWSFCRWLYLLSRPNLLILLVYLICSDVAVTLCNTIVNMNIASGLQSWHVYRFLSPVESDLYAHCSLAVHSVRWLYNVSVKQ